MRQQVRVARMPWADELQIAVFAHDGQGRQWVGQPLTMVEHGPGSMLMEPTFRLVQEEGQALMDELWASGLRPTEGSGSAGSLKATQSHLEDMRRIAFKKLGIE